MKRFLIQIHWENLLDHLRELGEAEGLADVEDWLQQTGFVRHDEGWLGDERTLAQLERTEVVSATRV